MPDASVDNPGRWFMVKVVNGAYRIVIRLRADWPTDGDIASYATAVSIGWSYVSDPGEIKPPGEANQQTIDFEAAIDELSMGNGHSYLMAVATGNGLKEWVYYTKDRVHFMERFNSLLSGKPTYPLKIQFYDDPTWKVWMNYREAYERTGGEPAARPPGVPADPGAGWFGRLQKRFGFGPGG
ncbi:MAG: DUF695 domain-containing protein [Planctomycetota bacterium]|nr:DUF695 domain-containing protein [Planctomycetota bacterium]